MTNLGRHSRGVLEDAGYIGVPLAILVAGIHLTHPKLGLPRLLVLLATGDLSLLVSHPRPLAFVSSGLAILAGIGLAAVGYRRKQLYGLGIALVTTFLVGYVAWHFSGHGGFLPGREPLYHGLSPLTAVIDHLSTDSRALLSKLAEIVLLAVLVTLYRQE